MSKSKPKSKPNPRSWLGMRHDQRFARIEVDAFGRQWLAATLARVDGRGQVVAPAVGPVSPVVPCRVIPCADSDDCHAAAGRLAARLRERGYKSVTVRTA